MYPNLEKLESNTDKDRNGRLPTLLIIADSIYRKKGAFKKLADSFSVLLYSSDLPKSSEVDRCAEKLIDCLSENRIKTTAILGIGQGSGLAQAISVKTSRVVRQLVLVDALTRVSPSVFQRLTDRIEARLPLGLPFRIRTNNYDSRSELHRIQCPTLVLRTEVEDNFLDSQYELIASRIPNSWKLRLEDPFLTDSNTIGEEMNDLLRTFFTVPAKSPQKII